MTDHSYNGQTPERVIASVLQSVGVASPAAVAQEVIQALILSAHAGGDEGALRWLDPYTDTGEGYILERLIRGEPGALETHS